MLDTILIEVAALLGLAGFISMVVNALKTFGVVKDGDADKWVAGMNFVAVMALYIVRQFIAPEFDPIPIDSALAEIAAVGTFILSFVVMIFGSKLTHIAVKGLPVIGKSFSIEKDGVG